MSIAGCRLSALAALVLLVGCTPMGMQSAPRDWFTPFNHPLMLTADAAEDGGIVEAEDFVLGVALGGEARAYPIDIMAVHELGNDTLGGTPIAVTW